MPWLPLTRLFPGIFSLPRLTRHSVSLICTVTLRFFRLLCEAQPHLTFLCASLTERLLAINTTR